MSSGILTQVINNLSRSNNTIQEYKDLPANALPIQHNIQNAISALLSNVTQMQHAVMSWGQKFEADLDEKLAMLEHLSTAELTLFIRQSEQAAAGIMSQMAETKKSTQSTDATVMEGSIALQRIAIDLQADIAGLNANLQSNQQNLDELNKKKLYFIALGIFGIPGLIALAVLLSNAQSEVNNIERQIAAQKSDIRHQQNFATQTTAISYDVLELSDQMLKIGNTIEFVSSDIANAKKNVSSGEAPQLMKLFFTAAKMNVHTLLQDVS